MSDHPPVAGPDGPDTELEIGLGDFLPEGTVLGDPVAEVDPVEEPEEDPVEEPGDEPVEGPGDEPVEGLAGDLVEGPADDPGRPQAPGASQPVGGAPVDLEALAGLERDLAAVDRALTALDDGSYGRCAVCGTELTAERLAADPVLRTCDEHRDAAAG